MAETNLVKPNSAGHEDVPEVVAPEDPRWRYAAPGSQERIVAWTSDGQPHRVELWALVGGKKLRPETGELSVSIVAPGGLPTLIGGVVVPLTEEGWAAFTQAERVRIEAFDTARRRAAAASEDPYWKARHDLARRLAGAETEEPPVATDVNVVDRHVESGAGRPATPHSSAAWRSTRSARSPRPPRSRRSWPTTTPTSAPGRSTRGWPTRAGRMPGWATGRTSWPKTRAFSSRP